MTEIQSTFYIAATVGVEHHVWHPEVHPDRPNFASWRLVGSGDTAYLVGTPDEIRKLGERLISEAKRFSPGVTV